MSKGVLLEKAVKQHQFLAKLFKLEFIDQYQQFKAKTITKYEICLIEFFMFLSDSIYFDFP